MLPMKSTLSKMTSQLVGLLPKKLMLEVSGLDAGKFWMVQFPLMLIWEGGTGLTKPSITAPFVGDGQLTDCACAGTALNSNSARGNSRNLIQLPRGFTLLMPLKIIYALVPSPSDSSVSGPRQPHGGLDFGGPAVMGLAAR